MVQIRNAEKRDSGAILRLIKELADYERMTNDVVTDETKLAAALFSENSTARALLAEVDGTAVGFALYFFNFSTFLGRNGLYLEDLYVQPELRGQGIGLALLKKLAIVAKEKNCGRMEWSVLDWNKPAVDFYLKLGAKAMTEWTTYRLTEKEIDLLATK